MHECMNARTHGRKDAGRADALTQGRGGERAQGRTDAGTRERQNAEMQKAEG